jgi:branched-chain amino acid transport system substrate-binding protein
MTVPIRIGELNSYSATVIAPFTGPYRRGIECAVEHFNARGGVIGRPVEILFRDDGLNPTTAVAQARALVEEEGVDLLIGTFNSDLALKVAEYAASRKVIFFAGEPRTDALVWEQGNRYTFRLRPHMRTGGAMMMDRLSSGSERRWASVVPNYDAGLRAGRLFREELKEARPDFEWVGEYQFPMGRLDVEDVLDWIERTDPDAINAGVLGIDLLNLVTAAAARGGALDKRLIINSLAGEPEYLALLGPKTPERWVTFGYPAEEIKTPEHDEFRRIYRAFAGEEPTLGALLGYTLVQIVIAGIAKAGTVNSEALVDAFEGLTLTAPFGRMSIRAGDHQSTMGCWLGVLSCVNGAGKLIDWKYLDGSDFLPSEDIARALRPASANLPA